jgi:hypothetical protein
MTDWQAQPATEEGYASKHQQDSSTGGKSPWVAASLSSVAHVDGEGVTVRLWH